MSCFEFRTRFELTYEAFDQAPVWVLFDDQEQAEEIASWGVDIDLAWQNRLKRPDPYGEYFYPYLGIAEVELVRGTYIAATAETFSGERLSGYLIGGFAFTLFCDCDQFIFNVNMPVEGQKAATRVAEHLQASEHEIFPIIFTTRSGRTIRYERFW